MRSAVRLLVLLSLTLTLMPPRDARAVGTRTFVLHTLEDLSGGDLKGVAVSSDGGVRVGFTLGNTPLPDAGSCFSSLTLADGSVLVGTGPSGKVFRVSGDQALVYAETKELAVTSMVQSAQGVVYAATIPDGKIVKITGGKVEPFVTLPDVSHVWALALDKTNSLFAATGPSGKIFRVEPSGATSVYFSSDEPHLVSLATGASGELYAGSSGKGILYKITGPGRGEVLYDFPVDEVRAIATSGTAVYAIANDYPEPPEIPRRSSLAGHGAAGPVSVPKPKPGKGALYRFDAQGRPEKLMGHSEFHYMSLALDDAGQPYVGTGAEGRVYTVDDTHVVTLVADTDERQIGALSLAGLKRGVGAPGASTFVCGTDPAAFHRVVAVGGADAVWTSRPLDAGLRARFGQLAWRASGPIEVSTRTGNTEKPDATWSAWSNPLAAPGPIGSPQGRYVQVRARFSRDPKAVLSEVTLPFVTENLRAIVLEVSAAPKAGTTIGTKEGLQPSGAGDIKHDSVLRVTWRVDNADADALRYRLAFRREEQSLWRDMLRADDVVTKTEYDWDTAALPEGKYRVRVEASDETSNPPDQVTKHALESATVLVDNTPPTLPTVAMAARRLKVRAVDGLGPIARVELAVDGKLEWRPLAPVDGVYDTADESIDTDVSSFVPAGNHILAVRAYDSAGNSVVREIEVP